jgi:hypothetical protein
MDSSFPLDASHHRHGQHSSRDNPARAVDATASKSRASAGEQRVIPGTIFSVGACAFRASPCNLGFFHSSCGHQGIHRCHGSQFRQIGFQARVRRQGIRLFDPGHPRLRIGNAAGVSFLFNGKEVPAEGNESEVKTVIFDASGFKSVAAQSPPEN